MPGRSVTVAVLGLGGMGSAALYHLARRGVRALGIEQFTPAHAKGSSHGRSRIIRQAYFESPRYVPLLRRAYDLWEHINGGAQEPVWNICGGITIGPRERPLIAGALEAAQMHAVRHEIFESRDARRRFPAFQTSNDEIAVYEPTVGMLFPEVCVAEHLRRATGAGAQARFGVAVTSIDADERGVTLRTNDGARIEADRLVICAGAWLPRFAGFPVRIERNVQHWFEPGPGSAPNAHVFMVQRAGWERLLYGFPDTGAGVKAAFHHSGEFLDGPGALDERASAQEIAAVRDALDGILTGGTARHLRADPCMYTVTPDEHFIVGAHPELPNAIVAGGFSGHGFKFCSVIGEILADLALEGTTTHDVSLFDPLRFRGTA